jgi:NAD(P)-dependent dehydrogenase (short-subunit alcohol dehydrogenase family)
VRHCFEVNNETVELVRRAGGEMTGIAPIDLTDPEQARKMVEDAVAAYGGLDVVYNNAAIQYFGPMPDFSIDDWRATITGDLDIPFFVEVRMAAPGPARWRNHKRRVHFRHDRRRDPRWSGTPQRKGASSP